MTTEATGSVPGQEIDQLKAALEAAELWAETVRLELRVRLGACLAADGCRLWDRHSVPHDAAVEATEPEVPA